MDKDVQTMRDELLYSQIKGGRTLNLVLAVVYGLVAIVAVVFTVMSVAKGLDIMRIAFIASLAVGCAASAAASFASFVQHTKALAEIGDNATGIDTCKTFSAETAKLIAMSRKPAQTLRQQFIAYAVITVMLLAFGVLLFACLGMPQFQGKDNSLLVGVGALMTGMGVLLLMLTVKTGRQWAATNKLEKLV